MKLNQYAFLLLFIFISMNSAGQLFLDNVEYDKIEQKKVREYIEIQQETNIKTVADIEPSVEPESSTNGFRSWDNEYIVKKELKKVWQHYVHSNPSESWNGKKVTFGLLFSKNEKRIVYKGDSINEMEPGQIVYLNLKLLKGIKNLATAFELTRIDQNNRIIEFSYLKGNSSEGKQRIQFFETPNGNTRILHTTYYKCHDIFKNYLFYSFFHTRATNEYHRNMKKIIMQ